MLSPLIPDIRHPKWAIVAKLLEIIASPRTHKIAGRLKISNVNNFIMAIKVLVLSDLFERGISRLVSEINDNQELKRLLGTDSKLRASDIYNLQSNLDYSLIQWECRGSRIPPPLGWGSSEPSPGFHVFLRLINKAIMQPNANMQLL